MDTWHWALIFTNAAVAAGLLHSLYRKKKIQQSLLIESSRHELMERSLDSAKMGTFDVNHTTGKITWSRHHELLFGFEPGTFDGTRAAFRSRVHPEDLPKFVNAVTVSRKNRCEYAVEVRVVRPDGSEVWVQGRGMPYFDSKGTCIRTMGTIIEITDRRHAEEKLLSVMDDLRKANSVKDQFLANISHDIRTPLSAVMGYADILLNEHARPLSISKDDAGKYLVRIKENARQLLVQIDSVIQYIQAELGTFKVVRNRTHVSDLLGAFCAGPRLTAKGRTVEIFSRLDCKENIIVTDSFIVSTIIEQLIENSLRHTDAEFIFLQAVIKKTDADHGVLEIVIKDSGRRSLDATSMASFNLHALQAADQVANPGGLEVGLPLACKLATILAGNITSRPAGEHCGSEFTVSLPISFPRPSNQTSHQHLPLTREYQPVHPLIN